MKSKLGFENLHFGRVDWGGIGQRRLNTLKTKESMAPLKSHERM